MENQLYHIPINDMRSFKNIYQILFTIADEHLGEYFFEYEWILSEDELESCDMFELYKELYRLLANYIKFEDIKYDELRDKILEKSDIQDYTNTADIIKFTIFYFDKDAMRHLVKE